MCCSACPWPFRWSRRRRSNRRRWSLTGGTLIDGNGGAPVADSVVVVQGNKITAVGRKGQVTVPAGARVINATGKFVLPGLWESQTAYS